MAIQLQPSETSIWRIVQAIIQLVNGRHNSSGQISLSINTTTTVVTAPNCSKGASPVLFPMTAHAAAALGTSWISSIDDGSFTLTHANNTQADRTFSWIATGG